jgi:hypothetical protein
MYTAWNMNASHKLSLKADELHTWAQIIKNPKQIILWRLTKLALVMVPARQGFAPSSVSGVPLKSAWAVEVGKGMVLSLAVCQHKKSD